MAASSGAPLFPGGMLLVVDQPAVGVFFPVELALLGLGQVAAVGFHFGVLLGLDGPVVGAQLPRVALAELAISYALVDARTLIVDAPVELIATRMLGGESAARRARRVAPTSRVGRRRQQQQSGQDENSLL